MVFNVTADIETDIGKIKENLVRQVATNVLWETSMRLILSRGVDTFIEVGPGNVLKGLMKRIEPGVCVYNVDTLSSAQEVPVKINSLNSK